jgi:hypothetical protein
MLGQTLAAAGLSAASERNVGASLESLAAALEPFQDLSAEQLAEYLRIAQEFRETGAIPEWVLGRKPAAPRARTPRAPKIQISPAEAVAQLRDLQQRSNDLSAEQVAEAVQGLAALKVDELKAVQREFLGATIGKKKEDMLTALRKKIDDFRASRERVEGILAL